MISYLSKIVLGLLVFLYPLFSYADAAPMIEPIPLGISLVGITILIPVVLSAVLLFMLRKKGVPLQPKPKTPIEKTRKEKRVLKLIKCFVILNVFLPILIYSVEKFRLRSDLDVEVFVVLLRELIVLSATGVLTGIGVLIGIFSVIAMIFSVIAMIFSMLFKKKVSVRARYWFLLFMVSYLPAQYFLSCVRAVVYLLCEPEMVYSFVILTQILFLLAIVVGLAVGYYKKIKKRND